MWLSSLIRAHPARIIGIKCLPLHARQKKRSVQWFYCARNIECRADQSDTVRCMKAEKRKGKLTRRGCSGEADERAVFRRARVSLRRFAIGFLLNTAFHPSYALSFVSSVRDTSLLQGYFFPSSYMHAERSLCIIKSQLNSVAATVKLDEYKIIDVQCEQAVRSSSIPSLVHEDSNTKEQMRYMSCTKIQLERTDI